MAPLTEEQKTKFIADKATLATHPSKAGKGIGEFELHPIIPAATRFAARGIYKAATGQEPSREVFPPRTALVRKKIVPPGDTALVDTSKLAKTAMYDDKGVPYAPGPLKIWATGDYAGYGDMPSTEQLARIREGGIKGGVIGARPEGLPEPGRPTVNLRDTAISATPPKIAPDILAMLDKIYKPSPTPKTIGQAFAYKMAARRESAGKRQAMDIAESQARIAASEAESRYKDILGRVALKGKIGKGPDYKSLYERGSELVREGYGRGTGELTFREAIKRQKELDDWYASITGEEPPTETEAPTAGVDEWGQSIK